MFLETSLKCFVDDERYKYVEYAREMGEIYLHKKEIYTIRFNSRYILSVSDYASKRKLIEYAMVDRRRYNYDNRLSIYDNLFEPSEWKFCAKYLINTRKRQICQSQNGKTSLSKQYLEKLFDVL